MKKVVTLATVAALVALAGPAAMAKGTARKSRPGVHAPVKTLKQQKQSSRRKARGGRHLAKRPKKMTSQNG